MYCTLDLIKEAEKEKISEMQFLRNLFEKNTEEDWTRNWVFFGTSGVHGSYCDLDDLEKNVLLYTKEGTIEPGEELLPSITVVIFMPRIVRSYYGSFHVTEMKDVDFLRHVSEKTFGGIVSSQNYEKYMPSAKRRKIKE